MTETFLAQRISLGGNRLATMQKSGLPEVDDARLLQSVARRVFLSSPYEQKQFLVQALPLTGLSRILDSCMMLSAHKFYTDTNENSSLVQVDSGISIAGKLKGASVIVPQEDSPRAGNTAEVLLELGEIKDFVWDATLSPVRIPTRAFVECSSIYDGGVHIPLSVLIPQGTYPLK